MGILKIFSGTSSLVREQRINLIRHLNNWYARLAKADFGSMTLEERNRVFAGYWDSCPAINALLFLAKKYKQETNLYGTQRTGNADSKNALSVVKKTG